MDVVVEVGRIAAGPGSIADRAEALLQPLHRLVPFQAARIYLLDPQRREQLSLASYGYDEAVSAYMDSPAITDEVELLGLNRDRRPMRVQDLPVPLAEVRGWAEYLQPAGFRGGLAVGLFTGGGRYLGLLGLNTETERHPTEAARDLIGRLAPVIAAAVDPMRSIAVVGRMVGDAAAGIVLTRTGAPLPLPGLPAHLLLATGSPLLPVAAAQLGGRTVASFLCPYQDGRSADLQVRITVLACPPDVPDYLSGIVLVSPPGDLRGLTPRELEILGLLVEGWSNPRIAAALVVADRTVAAHVEHILAKLLVPTRVAAAVLALRLGLYIPRLLTRFGAGPDR